MEKDAKTKLVTEFVGSMSKEEKRDMALRFVQADSSLPKAIIEAMDEDQKNEMIKEFVISDDSNLDAISEMISSLDEQTKQKIIGKVIQQNPEIIQVAIGSMFGSENSGMMSALCKKDCTFDDCRYFMPNSASTSKLLSILLVLALVNYL